MKKAFKISFLLFIIGLAVVAGSFVKAALPSSGQSSHVHAAPEQQMVAVVSTAPTIVFYR